METAKNPELGVGYAWSPLRPEHASPPETQLRQPEETNRGSFELERNDDVIPGTTGARLRSRAARLQRVRVLSTGGTTKVRVLFWRRSGDLWASTPVEWRYGPDDAVVVVRANRSERARSVKGWSGDPNRLVHIPLGGSRFGPMLVRIDLESSAPAEVELYPAKAVHGFVLPIGSEMQAWVRPLLIMFTTLGLVVAGRRILGLIKRFKN